MAENWENIKKRKRIEGKNENPFSNMFEKKTLVSNIALLTPTKLVCSSAAILFCPSILKIDRKHSPVQSVRIINMKNAAECIFLNVLRMKAGHKASLIVQIARDARKVKETSRSFLNINSRRNSKGIDANSVLLREVQLTNELDEKITKSKIW